MKCKKGEILLDGINIKKQINLRLLRKKSRSYSSRSIYFLPKQLKKI